MNRKYSGDIRDLFKIDLVSHLMKEIPSLHCFTFVPMLTEGEGKSGSGKGRNHNLPAAVAKGRAGSRNSALLRYMTRLQEIRSDTEYFRAIRDLFNHEMIHIRIVEKPVFSERNRDDYFNNLFAQFPERTLLLLDPDIGLEVKNSTKRHLLFDEVKQVYDHLDSGSVLMIYQHIPRIVRGSYIRKRCSELGQCTGMKPLTVTDNEIVFFFVAKDPRLIAGLEQAIGTYIAQYPALLMTG